MQEPATVPLSEMVREDPVGIWLSQLDCSLSVLGKLDRRMHRILLLKFADGGRGCIHGFGYDGFGCRSGRLAVL